MSTTDDPNAPGFEPPANDPPDPDFDVSEGEELALPPSAPRISAPASRSR